MWLVKRHDPFANTRCDNTFEELCDLFVAQHHGMQLRVAVCVCSWYCWLLLTSDSFSFLSPDVLMKHKEATSKPASSEDILIIPPRGSHPISSRFRLKDNMLMMVPRLVTVEALIRRVINMEGLPQDKDGVYFTGPQGIGKSHLLAHSVFLLDATFPTVRVCYVQDCDDWKRNEVGPIRYLVEELLRAFAFDTAAMKELSHSFKVRISTYQPLAFADFIFWCCFADSI